ncbi:putative Cell shape determination protein CcmA [Methylacidimicrobium sp. AP8]|uniref:bactofilin family protein n=1 Tax=Methylacidimicrobium sp. AP8 TaxID=2730359 RepID=UPI0018C17150|nr:polymer-forming cytoskeletal protein [Methylacidimicrobium sp. AP8]CAB4244075.1 putative Cell shape determination protein CcmA [Methylacidimicrobium sp. AP8]
MFGKLLKKWEPAKHSKGVDRPEEASPSPSVPSPPNAAVAAPIPPPPPPAERPPIPSRPRRQEDRLEPSAAGAEERGGASNRKAAPERPESKEEASVVAVGTQLRGELAFRGKMTLNGGFSGSIHAAEGCLWIGPEANVRADIEALDLVVEGKVRGSLSARKSLELRNGSDVQGSIRCLRLLIAEEAVFQGPCECFRPAPGEAAKAACPSNFYGFFTAVRVAAILP